jgi:hypothetical protein
MLFSLVACSEKTSDGKWDEDEREDKDNGKQTLVEKNDETDTEEKGFATEDAFVTDSSDTEENATEDYTPPQSGGMVLDIPKLAKNTKSLSAATVKKYNGNITSSGQIDSYTYTPPRDGKYTIWLSEVRSGVSFGMYLYNRLGERITYDYSASNGEYITAELKKGESYTIKINQYSSTGTYILSIGEQTATFNASAYSMISDSIVFQNQVNVYEFSPERDGRYTLWFTEVKSGISFSLYIYNHLGERVTYDNSASNGEYITADLQQSETYTIMISQYSGSGTYQLNIGKQKITIPIEKRLTVKDCIEFQGQENCYSIPLKEGENLQLSFGGMENGTSLNVRILNHLGEKVVGDSYLSNGEKLILANATADTYRIIVDQQSGFPSYTMTVN